jgi:hypothetical protein
MMLWHIQYFRHLGATFFNLLIIALALLAAALPLYHRLRQWRLWRYEPAILAGLPAMAALIYQPYAALVVLWLFIVAYAMGHWVLDRLVLMMRTALEDIVLAAGTGFGLLACAGFVLGELGGYYPLVIALLLGGVCVLFAREIPSLWSAARAAHRQWGESVEMRDGLGTLLVVFTALFIVAACMVVLAPSLAYDVLRYHLAEVKVYSAGHGLRVLPFSDFSYYPQSAEVLMVLAYSLGGQAAAQMATPLFYGLALLLLFLLARRCEATPLGAFAGMVFAGTLPFVHWTGSVAKNDLALAFYVLAPLYAFIRWHETTEFNWIRLGVFFIAIAAGVKLVVIYALPPLAIFYWIALWRHETPLRTATSLLALFAVFGLFWQARTFLLTGNPIYPWSFGHAVANHIAKSAGSGATALRLLELPWGIHFRGQRYFESVLPNPLGIFFLLFGPVWLLVGRTRVSLEERVCLVFSSMFLLYWAISGTSLRFAIAPTLLLAVMTGRRAVVLAKTSPWIKSYVLGGAAYALCLALLAAAIIEVNVPQLRLFAEKLDASGYLREALVTYPSLEYLRTKVAPGERVFGIGNCSAAYAPDPSAFDCVSPEEVVDWHPVAERIVRGDFRFVIVPSGDAGAGIVALLKGAELYRDANFVVYRLPGSANRN